MGGPKRRGPFGGGRMFEHGDLKLVILNLLEEKPRHGYEIIKDLEERSGGRYTPSAGAVYPTVTMPEDLGSAVATPEEGGTKVYAITDAGRAHLAEHRPVVDKLFDRVSLIGDAVFGDNVRPACDAMGSRRSRRFSRRRRLTYAVSVQRVDWRGTFPDNSGLTLRLARHQ
ncbi:hypothetical protein BH11GEM2_BH11GEM2_33590 [soil metagenome]